MHLKTTFAFLQTYFLLWVNDTINPLICKMLLLIFKKHNWKTLLTFNDSPHDGLQQGFSGSMVTGSTGFWNSNRQQSMILIIRWGGFASFLTVAISAGLIVYFKKNVTIHCMPQYRCHIFLLNILILILFVILFSEVSYIKNIQNMSYWAYFTECYSYMKHKYF